MEERKCLNCGKKYTPTRTFQKYCSLECRPSYRYRVEDAEKRRHKLCGWCGIEFYDNGPCNQQKYCSDRCRHLARNSQAADWQNKNYWNKKLQMIKEWGA